MAVCTLEWFLFYQKLHSFHLNNLKKSLFIIITSNEHKNESTKCVWIKMSLNYWESKWIAFTNLMSFVSHILHAVRGEAVVVASISHVYVILNHTKGIFVARTFNDSYCLAGDHAQ